MSPYTLLLLCISVTFSVIPVSSFYLPGVAPRDYAEGTLNAYIHMTQPYSRTQAHTMLHMYSFLCSVMCLSPVAESILVKVVKLDSVKTQLPYDYYSLPFCQPPTIEEGNMRHTDRGTDRLDTKRVHNADCPLCLFSVCVLYPLAGENLGEVLSGDIIENTPYKVFMGFEESCQIVCRRTYSNEDLSHFAEKIDEEYRVNWLLDSIPAATKYFTAALPSDDTKEPYVQHYEKGFALGFVGHNGTHNHVATLCHSCASALCGAVEIECSLCVLYLCVQMYPTVSPA